MPGIKDIISKGGVLPALASGSMGKENRGFALGIIPGMLYKDQVKDDEAEERARMEAAAAEAEASGMKKGGKVRAKKPTKKYYASGGSVKSPASKRADGCAQRGKTKGRMV